MHILLWHSQFVRYSVYLSLLLILYSSAWVPRSAIQPFSEDLPQSKSKPFKKNRFNIDSLQDAIKEAKEYIASTAQKSENVPLWDKL